MPLNQEQPGIVQTCSRPVLAQWNKGQNTMKHNFAALYTCIVGASRVLGTVRNGSERFLAHGVLCVLLACSDIFWLSSTKSPPAENMTGTRNKHDLQETEGQEDLHTNRNPCPVTAGKQVQRRQTFDMLWHDRVPPERISACIQHARCQRAFCALLGSISEHLEHREWCEWPTKGLRNTSACLGLHSLFLGVLCLWDARLWGKVAGGSICWVPACLFTSQILLRDKFPDIVSKISNIVSKIETFSFQDVWYRFQDGFWPTDKEATGRSNIYDTI